MRRERSDSQFDAAGDSQTGITLELRLPLGGIDLFRYGASEDILTFLALNPDIEVSTRQLADVIEFSEKATRQAVDILEQTSLIKTERDGNRRLVSINKGGLNRPEDPINQIPQTEYRLPVRLVVHNLQKKLEGILGVVLFGSVARGEANPKSDIDLWVLVTNDRQQQLHRANRVSNRMSGLQIPPEIAVDRSLLSAVDSTALGSDKLDDYLEIIENQDRSFSSVPAPDVEILVETPESALNQKGRISSEIFKEGISLVDSPEFENVLHEVIQA